VREWFRFLWHFETLVTTRKDVHRDLVETQEGTPSRGYGLSRPGKRKARLRMTPDSDESDVSAMTASVILSPQSFSGSSVEHRPARLANVEASVSRTFCFRHPALIVRSGSSLMPVVPLPPGNRFHFLSHS